MSEIHNLQTKFIITYITTVESWFMVFPHLVFIFCSPIYAMHSLPCFGVSWFRVLPKLSGQKFSPTWNLYCDWVFIWNLSIIICPSVVYTCHYLLRVRFHVVGWPASKQYTWVFIELKQLEGKEVCHAASIVSSWRLC
jgi:hypothetical protein